MQILNFANQVPGFEIKSEWFFILGNNCKQKQLNCKFILILRNRFACNNVTRNLTKVQMAINCCMKKMDFFAFQSKVTVKIVLIKNENIYVQIVYNCIQ